MLLAYLCMILCFKLVNAQSSRQLDVLLQDYAFRAFVRPRTGVVFDAAVPANLSGIEVAAIRLRSGSLRRRGVSSFKEFHIPVGVVEQPYVERVILVYHNLANWSSFYYPLPGYRFLTPVLGLLAYDAYNLSASDLPELDIRASGRPISVKFPYFQSGPGSSMCVYFGLDGSVGFDNVVGGNTCLTTNQGHYAIVVESLVSPAPSPVAGGGGGVGGGGEATSRGGGGGGGGGTSKRVVWISVGSVVGGTLALFFLAILFAYVRRYSHRKKIARMEEEAEVGVPLPMTPIGTTKAPVALNTRTKPYLENEFVP